MKPTNYIAAGFLVSSILSACTPKMTFVNSSIVPAATGSIAVKKDKNKNYTLTISVLNLAEPQKLDPPKDTYVVWMESDQDPVKKLGQLMPRAKALKGELKATSTDKPNQVFITAEDNAERSYPSGQIVLTTKK